MATPITKSIIVNRDVSDVYRLWSNFENIPHFMNHIRSVTKTGDRTSHWVMDGPLGKNLEWDAVISDLQENKRIAWNSTDETEKNNLRTTGQVMFRSLAPNETEITASLTYEGMSGSANEALARLLDKPETKLVEDLKSFKKYAESSGTTKHKDRM